MLWEQVLEGGAWAASRGSILNLGPSGTARHVAFSWHLAELLHGHCKESVSACPLAEALLEETSS